MFTALAIASAFIPTDWLSYLQDALSYFLPMLYIFQGWLEVDAMYKTIGILTGVTTVWAIWMVLKLGWGMINGTNTPDLHPERVNIGEDSNTIDLRKPSSGRHVIDLRRRRRNV